MIYDCIVFVYIVFIRLLIYSLSPFSPNRRAPKKNKEWGKVAVSALSGSLCLFGEVCVYGVILP